MIDPQTHQGLLNAYVDAASRFGEWSTDFLRDSRAIVDDVEEYAKLHDLSTDCLAELRRDIRNMEANL